MRRALIGAIGVGVLVALVQGAAVANAPEKPGLISPLPFDHGVHGKAFAKGGVACVNCHPVGVRQPDASDGFRAPPGGDLWPSLDTCHGCHLGELKGAPRAASSACMQCHGDREQLVPATHAVGWLYEHGGEARARGASCSDCHKTSQCTECHEARGPDERSPHPPGWRTIHGLEARVDSYSCSTCHDGTKCVSCHTTGATPW